LIYAVGSRLRRQGQRSTGGRGPLIYRLISARFLRDLAEIMLLIDFRGASQNFLEVSDQPASLTNPARFVNQCGLRQENSPATSENSAAFWREEFKNGLF
jgi:hypothetical protein